MSNKKRTVLVDIDEFKQDLGYRIGESEDEKWSAEYMFETIEDDFGNPISQLKVEGIDQTMQPALDILEDLYFDQENSKAETTESILLGLCKRFLDRRPIGGNARDLSFSEGDLIDFQKAVDIADPQATDYFRYDSNKQK